MTDRKCKQCGDNIPNRIVVKGKHHNIKNRRYCIKCVPFGTKSRLHSSSALSNNKESKKRNRAKAVKWQKENRIKRKTKLVQMHGGKCKDCGYDKCIACLTFHHKNPENKLFNVSAHLNKKWDVLVKESNKCILLCHNCHMELHYKACHEEI